jgi:hypothetical protein
MKLALSTFEYNNKIYIEYQLPNGEPKCDVYNKTQEGLNKIQISSNDFKQKANKFTEISLFLNNIVKETKI